MVTAVLLEFEHTTMLMGVHDSEFDAIEQIESCSKGGTPVIRLMFDEAECRMLSRYFRKWARMHPNPRILKDPPQEGLPLGG